MSHHPKESESSFIIHQIFREYDKSGKGWIDLNDMRIVIRQLAEDISEKDLDIIVKKCSRSSEEDPKITFEDFYDIMTVGTYF